VAARARIATDAAGSHRTGGASMSLRATLLSSYVELRTLESAWDELLGESETDGPMVSPLWLLAWWRVFGALDGRKLAVVAFHDGARLVGLAPLLARTCWYKPGLPFRRLELLGSGEREEDEVCSEYLGVIAARGFEGEVARALADALAGGDLGAWDELVLTAMARDGAMPARLAEELARIGAAVDVAPSDESRYVALPGSFDAYLAGLSSSGRYLVTRSLRDFERWSRGEAALRVATTRAELEEGRRALVALHGERWSARGGGAFASARFSAFHDDVMPRLLDRGALELIWLTVRGEPIAAAYEIVWRDRVHFYQSGRKLDVPKNVRPGIVLHARALERAIARGLREYDFLGGPVRYKRDLAPSTRTLVRLRAVHPRARLRERGRAIAAEGAAAARAAVRAIVPRRAPAREAAADPIAVLHGDLNMLRCFARAGIRTVSLASDPDAPTFFSRHCGERRVIADSVADPTAALADLLALGRLLPDRPILYYGDDALLLLISRHRAKLAERFRFRMPPAALIEALVDKARFVALARERELPVPRTLLSSDARRAGEIARLLPLPVILKPTSHLGFRRSPAVLGLGKGPLKAFYAGDVDELARMIERIESFSPDFVVQEFIPGGEEQIYTFHAYLDGDRRALGCYVGRKIRTYPRSAGVSTFLELVDEPELVRLGLDVLDKLGMSGVVKLDFKRDPRTGRFYLLEVNPRFNLWNHLGAAAGVNLPLLAYRDLAGKPVSPAPPARTGIRWLSLADDVRTFVRDYGPAGELTLRAWLASLVGPTVFDVFAWDDPSPFLMDMARSLRDRRAGAARA
jgi:predicted ATP-grasp superfamily ATP-dependent carboligase/CelD/BcsL family acetyltransferase involved in cellulose biosynthesis